MGVGITISQGPLSQQSRGHMSVWKDLEGFQYHGATESFDIHSTSLGLGLHGDSLMKRRCGV